MTAAIASQQMEQHYGLRPSGSVSSLALFAAAVGRRARVPARNRLLAGLVRRFERPPHFVHAVVEEIADQQIGERAAQVRVLAHHAAEAEAVVVLADQPAHAIDAFVERLAPLAELRPRRVVLRQSFDDRIGSHLARSKRQQHAGGVQGVEKAERVADEHPAVARHLLRPVRIVLRREVAGDLRRPSRPAPSRRGRAPLPRRTSSRNRCVP